MFRIVAGVIFVALLVAALGNVQQGLERFRRYRGVAPRRGLAGLPGRRRRRARRRAADCPASRSPPAGSSSSCSRSGRSTCATLFGPVALVVPRDEARAVGGFSLRLQMTTCRRIVNSQTDKVIVGLRRQRAGPRPARDRHAGRRGGPAARRRRAVPVVSRLAITHGDGRRRAVRRPVRAPAPHVDAARDRRHRDRHPRAPPAHRGLAGRRVRPGGLVRRRARLRVRAQPAHRHPVAYLRALGRPSLEARFGAVPDRLQRRAHDRPRHRLRRGRRRDGHRDRLPARHGLVLPPPGTGRRRGRCPGGC